MGWTSPIDRRTPDRLADERGALTQQLDFHRATLLTKLEGLDDEQLRRPGTASGLSLLGILQHLTATERGWLVEVYGGAPAPDDHAGDDADDPDDFLVAPEATLESLVAAYLQICEQGRALVAAGSLDDVVTTPSGAEVNLRAILVHLLQETARHNGHADVVREAIDGRTGH